MGQNQGPTPSSDRGTTYVASVRAPDPNHGVRPHFVQEHDALLFSPVSRSLSCLLSLLTTHAKFSG